MFVTIQYVKCKAKKCGEAIVVDKPLAPGEARELRCRRGHTNRYGASAIDTRTEKAAKRSYTNLKRWW